MTGLIIVGVALFIEKPVPIVLIAIFFAAFNYITIKTRFIKGLSSRKHSLGTVFYPLGVVLLIMITWESYRILFVISVLILAVADALAAIVGENIRKPHTFSIWGDSKSLEGSVAMFLSAFLIIYAVVSIGLSNGTIAQPVLAVWILSFVSAFYITVSEAISIKGSDNVNVAIVSALSLKIFIFDTFGVQEQFLWAHLYAAAAALISYKLKFLTFSGSVTTYFIAVIIFGLGGWSWTIPILVFFILSSILTKMGKKHKKTLETVFEKGSVRDAQQVLANGGLATFWVVCYYFMQEPLLYIMYLATLAAATSDTWATEIGAFSRGRVWLITTLKPVEKGRSGGISIIGTFGSLAGSFAIGLTGLLYLELFFELINPYYIMLFVTLAGFTGSLIDSLLGATLQAQYRCVRCDKITEKRIHCEREALMESGYSRINNDVVNFGATVTAVLFVWLIF